MSENLEVDLESWRKDRQLAKESSAARVEYTHALHGLERTFDALFHLHKPWVSALYDQLGSMDIKGDFSQLNRMADIAAQNGMHVNSAEAIWEQEYSRLDPAARRLVEVVGVSQDIGGLEMNYPGLEDLVRTSAKSWFIGPGVPHRSREYIRALRSGDLPPERVESYTNQVIAQLKKHDSTYQAQMDHLEAPLREAIGKAEVVLGRIQKNEIKVETKGVSAEEKLSGMISKAHGLLENNVKPTYSIDEKSLGEERALKKEVEHSKNRLEHLRKRGVVLAQAKEDLGKVSMLDDPGIQEHLLNEVSFRIGAKDLNRLSLTRDSASLDSNGPLYSAPEVTYEEKVQSVIRNRDRVLLDKAAESSPVLAKLLPNLAAFSPLLRAFGEDKVISLPSHESLPDLMTSALAMGLEKTKWVEGTEGRLVRPREGPHSFDPKKFWKGFLSEYDRVDRYSRHRCPDQTPHPIGGLAAGSSQEAAALVDEKIAGLNAEIQEISEFLERHDGPGPQDAKVQAATPNDVGREPASVARRILGALGVRRGKKEGTPSRPTPKGLP